MTSDVQTGLNTGLFAGMYMARLILLGGVDAGGMCVYVRACVYACMYVRL